jgi:hypothetical protein
MLSRRAQRRVAWLLPLLCARLLVPTGFMVAPSSAGIGIALCPGYAPLPIPAAPAGEHDPHAGMDHGAHAMHGGSHGSHGMPESGQHSKGQSSCPFALAGGTADLPVMQSAADLPRLVNAVPGFHPHAAWISPAVLINRIRGPPVA